MGHPDPSAFGALLRQRRAEAGLTQEELAERAGVSTRVISDLERGVSRRPHFHTVRQLAEALGLTGQQRDGFAAAARGPAQLKGVSQPVRVVQVLPEGGADIAASTRPSASPSPLPPQATPFVGRVQEVAEVTALLRQEEVRLLTLTGAGGTGKTRLALQVAESLLAHFSAGAVFVSLAATADPALVVSSIASALGVKETAGHPLLETLTSALGDRQLLLVLDNFEHLLPAATIVADLVGHAPRLKVLVTSRAVLHLSSEHEYPVPPLELPDTTGMLDLPALARCDAVALFLARARAVNPHFALTQENARDIAEICARLDGLPLAIELAAARLRLFPPKALLSRLSSRLSLLTGGPRDLPARQQTLRDTIEWSYALLSPAEQELFARLSVFAGGCTLEAAEAVCDGNGDLGIDLVDGLGSLVEKNLLRQEGVEEPRFSMLETIGEYAAERFSEQDRSEQIREAHAAYFRRLAEDTTAAFGGPNRAVQENRAIAEFDNIRAALQWLLDRGRAEEELCFASSISLFMNNYGERAEAMRWLEVGLALSSGVNPSVRARALSALSGVEAFDHYDHAIQHAEEALALYQTADDLVAIAGLSLSLASLEMRAGKTKRARTLVESVLHGNQGLPPPHSRADAMHLLGEIALMEDDVPAAKKWFEKAIAAYRANGDQIAVARCLIRPGEIELLQGKVEEGRRTLLEALAVMDASGQPVLRAGAAHALAILDREQGEYDRALARFQESLMLRPREHYWFRTTALGDMAELAALVGQGERAACLGGAASAHRERLKMPPLVPLERRRREQRYRQVRERIEEDAWNRAWQEGRAMSLEAAVSYALEGSAEGP